MDIMGIERIEREEQCQTALLEIRKLAVTEPNSESEAADIINHLSTLVQEWLDSHPLLLIEIVEQESKIVEQKDIIPPIVVGKSLDKQNMFAIMYIRARKWLSWI